MTNLGRRLPEARADRQLNLDFSGACSGELVGGLGPAFVKQCGCCLGPPPLALQCLGPTVHVQARVDGNVPYLSIFFYGC